MKTVELDAWEVRQIRNFCKNILSDGWTDAEILEENKRWRKLQKKLVTKRKK
jgi:hypothetical protein